MNIKMSPSALPSSMQVPVFSGDGKVTSRRNRFPNRGDELGKMWGYTYWSSDRAKQVLGYKPKHNFPQFFEALKEGNEAHYPHADFP